MIRALAEKDLLESCFCTETRPYNQVGFVVDGGVCFPVMEVLVDYAPISLVNVPNYHLLVAFMIFIY